MGEVVHLLAARLGLQKLNRPLLQVLQQDDIVLADLIEHFSLKVVVGLQVTGTDPERLPFELVRHQAD